MSSQTKLRSGPGHTSFASCIRQLASTDEAFNVTHLSKSHLKGIPSFLGANWEGDLRHTRVPTKSERKKNRPNLHSAPGANFPFIWAKPSSG